MLGPPHNAAMQAPEVFRPKTEPSRPVERGTACQPFNVVRLKDTQGRRFVQWSVPPECEELGQIDSKGSKDGAETWGGFPTGRDSEKTRWNLQSKDNFCTTDNLKKLRKALADVHATFNAEQYLKSGSSRVPVTFKDLRIENMDVASDDHSLAEHVEIQWSDRRWMPYKEACQIISEQRSGSIRHFVVRQPAPPAVSVEHIARFRTSIDQRLSSPESQHLFQVKLIASLHILQLAGASAPRKLQDLACCLVESLRLESELSVDQLAEIMILLSKASKVPDHVDANIKKELESFQMQVFCKWNPNQPGCKQIVSNIVKSYVDRNSSIYEETLFPSFKQKQVHLPYLLKWFCDFFNIDRDDYEQLESLNGKLACVVKYWGLRESIQQCDIPNLKEEILQLMSRLDSAERLAGDVAETGKMFQEFEREWLELQFDYDIKKIALEMQSLYNQVKSRLHVIALSPQKTNSLVIYFLERIEKDLQTGLQRLEPAEHASRFQYINQESLKQFSRECLSKNKDDFREIMESIDDSRSADEAQLIEALADLDQIELIYKDMQCSMNSFEAATGFKTAEAAGAEAAWTALNGEISDEELSTIKDLRANSKTISSQEELVKFRLHIDELSSKQKEKKSKILEIQAIYKRAEGEASAGATKPEMNADEIEVLSRLVSNIQQTVVARSSSESLVLLDWERIHELAHELLLQLQPPVRSISPGKSDDSDAFGARHQHQLQWVQFVREQTKETTFLFVIHSLVRQEARDVLYPDYYKNISLRREAYQNSLTSFNDAVSLQYPELEEHLRHKLNHHFQSLDSKTSVLQFMDERMLKATAIDPRRSGVYDFVGMDTKSSEASLQEAYDQRWRCLKARRKDNTAKHLGMPLAPHKYTDFFNVPPVLTVPPETSDPFKLEKDLREAISEFNDKNSRELPDGIYFPYPDNQPRTVREMWEALEYAYRLFPFQAKRRDLKHWKTPNRSDLAQGKCWWQREGYSGLEPFPHEFATKETVDQHPQFWVFDHSKLLAGAFKDFVFSDALGMYRRETSRTKQYDTTQAALVEYCWFASPTIFEDWHHFGDSPSNIVRGKNTCVYEASFHVAKSKSKQCINIDLAPLAQMFKCDLSRNVISKRELNDPLNPKDGKRSGSAITAYEVDHIFPWDLGGLTVIQNLQALHAYANGIKSKDCVPASQLCFGLPSPKLLDMYIYLTYLALFPRSGVAFDEDVGIRAEDPVFSTLDPQDYLDKSNRRSKWVLRRLEHILCYDCRPQTFQFGGLPLALANAQAKVGESMGLKSGLAREKTQITMLAINRGREYYKVILYKVYPELDANSEVTARLQRQTHSYDVPSYNQAVTTRWLMGPETRGSSRPFHCGGEEGSHGSSGRKSELHSGALVEGGEEGTGNHKAGGKN